MRDKVPFPKSGHIYIVRANFVLITRKKAERNFEIAARTLCLRVCGATPRFTAAVKIPLPRQHFSSRILFDRKLSESYFFRLWIKQRVLNYETLRKC